MAGGPSDPNALRIPFGRPAMVGRELEYITEAVAAGTIAGGGPFTRRCEAELEAQLPAKRVLLAHSCTAALEMAAMLVEVGPGDEVIMPSFTFSSTATAFVLRGATPVFVDIKPETLNLDENLVEDAITKCTKAVVPVHYAGLACQLGTILEISSRRNLFVIEDAAQAHFSTYKGRSLGTIGHLGCLSFHETKNIISGEGGALVINDEQLAARAEIIRDKGTDRSRFFRGEVDKYTWQDIGSSYAPGELVSAFLYAQLEHAEEICARRRGHYELYQRTLGPLQNKGHITIPRAGSQECNGHIFWLLVEDLDTRTRLLKYLNERGINAVFHYVPLHSAPAGMRYGRTSGELPVTNSVSSRLIRLPLYLEMTEREILRVSHAISQFFGGPVS